MAQTIIPQGANAIIFSDDKVLTIETATGLAFPGGTYEPDIDNSLEHCCSRELLEETGLEIPFQGLQRVLSIYTRSIPLNPKHSPDFIDSYYVAILPASNREHVFLSDSAAWIGKHAVHKALVNQADRWAFTVATLPNLQSVSAQP